jgi:hypothetical protein
MLAEAALNTAHLQNGETPSVPPPLPPPKRLARAMVSTCEKGSIPVTLGGRPPPVSILSRREFGLRVLRK